MSADDNEPAIEPVACVGRGSLAEIITDGAECWHCGKVVKKPRSRLYIFARDPVTGRMKPVKVHPRPKRYFRCPCGRKWSRRIPKSQIKIV